MNKEDYVKNFNNARGPEARRLSLRIMDLFEEKTGMNPPYSDHSNFRDQISDFLSRLDTITYVRLSEGKSSRNREKSLLKNTSIEIKAFPINQELHHSWQFIAHSLDTNEKYCWNRGSEDSDRRSNKNQVYFNPQEVIDDFLKIKIEKYPLSVGEKLAVIKFLEKYGPYFIRYYNWESESPEDKEWYFWHFWLDHMHFKEAYQIIKSKKVPNFPNASCPPRTLNRLYKNKDGSGYEKWHREVGDPQLFFNLCLSSGHLPKKIIKNKPQDMHELGRGIGVICDYLYMNCKKMIICGYSKCEKTFFKQSKNQSCCCPHHSSLMRSEKSKKKSRAS
jgi:hypothetical protein